MRTIKQDNELINILKLSRVDRIICDTDKGPLKLCIRKGENNYFFTLDATELPKDINKELMDLLFPITKYEEVKQNAQKIAELRHDVIDKAALKNALVIKNKGGRPKKK